MSENTNQNVLTTPKRSPTDMNIVSVLLSALKKASVVGVVYFAGYMQWSVAWFIGPLVLLVIRDQWRITSDAKRSSSKAAALASEKDVVLARLNDLPAWVFFPDVERTEWLNKIIKQTWPNVNLYVKQIVRDSVQPALKEALEKYKLSGFKFERIILGTVPFRIGGVKVYDKNVDRNEIIMDLDIFYAGDCDVTFHLKGMKGGIRDFQLHGMLRVVMKPLITSMPLVGGIQVFFLNNPDIDFDLVGIADFLDMPGLSDILRRIVVETVANIMVLPNKFPIKLSDEVEAAELKTPEPEGVLRVHIVEAKHLMKKDISMMGKGKSDPYCVVTVGAQEFKTKVIDNTVDPKWDYWCEFNILESNGQQLYVYVWDKDDPGDDESLGRATIEVENLVKKGYEDTWVTLEQAKHGMVHLRFYWLTLSDKYDDLEAILFETKNLQSSALSTALLTIFIDSAKNLPQARTSTKPDPYAVLRVGSQTQKTNVLMRTIHPVWEEGFTFFVANPENDSLHLSIVDQKTNSEIGNFVYKIKNIFKRTKMEFSKEPFALLKSGPESKILWSMHLRILKKNANDKPELLRSSSRLSTSSISSVDSRHTLATKSSETSWDKNDKNNLLEEGESDPLLKEEMNKTSTACLEGAADSNSDTVILRRNPSTTSFAGEAGLGRILLTIIYSVERQRLIVNVHKIANIPLRDPSSIPDPYVKLYLLPERSKETKRKTQIIKDNCNPIFEENFEYIINQAEVYNKKLEITACTQKQLFGGTNFLGQVILDLSAIDISQPFNAWYDLMPEQ